MEYFGGFCSQVRRRVGRELQRRIGAAIELARRES